MHYHRVIQAALLLAAASTMPVCAQELLSYGKAGPRIAATAPTRTSLAYPQSVFVDAPHGNLWVADFDNNRVLRFDISSLTGVTGQAHPRAAESPALEQNFPNPFNPSTCITFSVPNTEYATLTVFDVLGREVATLFAGTAVAHHRYTVSVSATNLPSGLYFYALRSAARYEVKTMSVLK